MLCKTQSFKKALKEAIALLDDEYLKEKGLVIGKNIDLEPVKKMRLFLNIVNNNFEVADDYSKILEILEQNKKITKKLSPLIGYMGKILDAIQLIKPESLRHNNAKKYLENNLSRTGHEGAIKELEANKKDWLYSEIIKSSALYILLEATHLAFKNKSKVLNTLRRSKGDRLPEEYFSELLSGWIIEQVFIKKIKELGFSVNKTGVDEKYSIQLVKPKNMGTADLKIKLAKKSWIVELQRVGKASQNGEYFKTELKEHKIKKSKEFNVLWFGDHPANIKEKNKVLWNKILIIKNSKISKQDDDSPLKWVKAKNNGNRNIFFKKEFLINSSINSFAEVTKKSLLLLLEKD